MKRNIYEATAHESIYRILLLLLMLAVFLGILSISSHYLATGWTVRGSNPGGGEIFLTRPDRPWGPPSRLYKGHRVFPGGKEWPGVTLIPQPLLVPWSRKSRAIPLLPLWPVRPVQSLSACSKVHFTLTYTCTHPMDRTAWTEPQCLYNGVL